MMTRSGFRLSDGLPSGSLLAEPRETDGVEIANWIVDFTGHNFEAMGVEQCAVLRLVQARVVQGLTS